MLNKYPLITYSQVKEVNKIEFQNLIIEAEDMHKKKMKKYMKKFLK